MSLPSCQFSLTYILTDEGIIRPKPFFVNKIAVFPRFTQFFEKFFLFLSNSSVHFYHVFPYSLNPGITSDH